MHRTIDGVREDYANLRNNTAAAKLIEYTNYLTKEHRDATPRAAVEPLVLMVAPLAPHLAEELWQTLVRDHCPDAPGSVHLAGWPEPVAALADPELVAAIAATQTAIRLGRALEEFDLTWFEEPLPAWDLDGLARVAAALEGRGGWGLSPHRESRCGSTPTPTLPRKRERERSADVAAHRASYAIALPWRGRIGSHEMRTEVG